MTRVAVCKLSEIAEGELKAVHASGRDLVLLRHGDELFALRDVCPHYGARLSGGVATCARLAGGVGEYPIDEGVPIVRCPWHNWEFDARSGSCHQDSRKRVAIYETEVVEGEVFVTV